jgi:hypothetical protein
MQTAKTFQRVTDATLSRSRGNWDRIRTIAFSVTTFIILFELVAGSVWNLKPIEWNVVQLRHLGYPAYLAYILGAWHVGAAVAIAAPGLPKLGLPPETRPLAWAAPIAILLLLYVASFLTLPAVEAALHERAVKLGWSAR